MRGEMRALIKTEGWYNGVCGERFQVVYDAIVKFRDTHPGGVLR